MTKFIKKIIDGTKNSLAGFKSALLEPAFFYEFLIALILIPIAIFFGKDLIAKLLLLFSIFLVLIVEVLNTAIEKTIDRISLEIHPLSKKVKDFGSFAVFLSILNFLIVWGFILYNQLTK